MNNLQLYPEHLGFWHMWKSIINYCITVCGSAAQKHYVKYKKYKIEQHDFFVQNFVQNFDWNICRIDIVRDLGWQNVKERYCFLSCCPTYKFLNNLASLILI